MFDIGKLIDFPKLLVDQAIAVLIAFLAISYINPTTKGGVFVLGAVVIVTVNAVVVVGRVLRRALSRWNELPKRARSKRAVVVPPTPAPADAGSKDSTEFPAPDLLAPIPAPLPETAGAAAVPTDGDANGAAPRAKAAPAISGA
jgi:hypothetical protein